MSVIIVLTLPNTSFLVLIAKLNFSISIHVKISFKIDVDETEEDRKVGFFKGKHGSQEHV